MLQPTNLQWNPSILSPSQKSRTSFPLHGRENTRGQIDSTPTNSGKSSVSHPALRPRISCSNRPTDHGPNSIGATEAGMRANSLSNSIVGAQTLELNGGAWCLNEPKIPKNVIHSYHPILQEQPIHIIHLVVTTNPLPGPTPTQVVRDQGARNPTLLETLRQSNQEIETFLNTFGGIN